MSAQERLHMHQKQIAQMDDESVDGSAVKINRKISHHSGQTKPFNHGKGNQKDIV
jgi:hypothetical protein